MDLSIKQVRQIKSHLKKKNCNSISAKEFNKILLDKNTPVKNKSSKKSYDYSFTFNIEKIDSSTYKIILKGKHLSTNASNSILSLGRKKAYKDAIKKAAYEYYLVNKKTYKELIPVFPFENAIIKPIAYNPRSRDDDGCAVTLKTLRDLLTTYKLIKDDSRKYLKQLPTEEVISKDYKIELILKSVE